ncbi:MAG TPA: (2Fe-2S)-binding protein [bacterium]|nr:(2Fe-2S)-binding protein [bacterium]
MLRIHLVVNGSAREVEVDSRRPLVHVLRDQLGLTGTRFGCLTGHCGACTVRLEGRAVKSCTILAASADGQRIETIEGVAHDGNLHPVQRAFWEHFGFQCGFCTPGMIMTALEVLAEHPHPDEATIREALAGNLCRCTGYQAIVDAILAAADVRVKDPSGGTVR